MSVFALQADIFYKYVFVLIEYDILFKNVFLYFMKMYFNVSMSKYVHKNVLSCKKLHTYAHAWGILIDKSKVGI